MNKGRLLNALAACALAAFAGCHTIPPPVYIVNASPKTPQAQRLAEDVAIDIRGTLVKRGYPVVFAEPEDKYTPVVSIDLLFDRRETATLDVWRAYEGAADAKVLSIGGVHPRYKEEEILVGEKSFRVAGDKADNEIDAELSVHKGLSEQLVAWLSEVLLPARAPEK